MAIRDKLMVLAEACADLAREPAMVGLEEWLADKGTNIAKINGRIMTMFGLCLAEFREAGMTPDAVGALAAYTMLTINGVTK